MKLNVETMKSQDNLNDRVKWSCILASIVVLCTFSGFIQFLAAAIFFLGALEWIQLCDNIKRQADNQKSNQEPHNQTRLLTGLCVLASFALAALNMNQFYRTDFIRTLLLVWTSDISAYFAGSWSKESQSETLKLKPWPQVSPNKTLGGCLGAYVMCLIIGQCLGFTTVDCSLVAFCAQLGDLVESLMKRLANQKDSNLTGVEYARIPGHGGILDRIDGLIITVPVMFFKKSIGL